MSDCNLSGNPPYDCAGCDLTGRNLAGKDLTNANFQGAILSGANFQGVKSLTGANFTGAVMYGTDFSGCNLSDAIFGSSPKFSLDSSHLTKFIGATIPFKVLGKVWNNLDLTDADITDIPDDLTQLQCTGAILPGFSFAGRILDHANFRGSTLEKADFSGAHLNNAIFQNDGFKLTDLTGAKFIKCRLRFAVFDGARLTKVNFAGSVMEGVTLLHSRMDGTIFDNIDVTTCSFSWPPQWSSAPGNNTSFKGATLNYRTIRRRWSFLDLNDATIVGLDPSVDLTSLHARYANLTNMDLSHYTLNQANFSGAILAGVKFCGSHMDHARLNGAQGDKPIFDGACLAHARFDPIVEGNETPKSEVHTILHGASFLGANLTNANFFNADFGPAGNVVAKFQGAQMDHLAATGANLTGAQLNGGISMHAANFTFATLKGADMTGALLGGRGNLFTLKKGPDYTLLLQALNTGDVATVVAIFGKYGTTLGDQTNISPTLPGVAWQVQYLQTTYTVLLVTASDRTQSLQVFAPETTDRGFLSGAFMPDAILTDANLISVDAHGVQLFSISSQKQLAGAIMYDIDLSHAILGSDVEIDMTEAQLYRATLSHAFLINAKLANANLSGANLDGAHLQGADFTDAAMTGAVALINSAVSTLVQTNASDGTSVFAVYLFDLPQTDANYTAIHAELVAAANLLLLASEGDGSGDYDKLVSSLNALHLDVVQAAFKQKGVQLSSATSVRVVDRDPKTSKGVAWQLTDPSPAKGNPSEYTVWAGYDPLGDSVIVARPDLPQVRELFLDKYEIHLRPQTTVTSSDATDGTKAWTIDNDSTNPSNLDTGYVVFLTQLRTDSLVVYGTEIHATRLKSAGQLEMTILTFNATKFCKTTPCSKDGSNTYLQPDTVCPNGIHLSDNQTQKMTWEKMMRAREHSPHPPPCIPSPYAPCT